MLIKQTHKLTPRRMRVNILAAVSLVCAALLTTSPAFANQSAETEVRFKIDRADLEAENTLNRVYVRLQNKAETACENSGLQSFLVVQQQKLCMDDLLNDFVESVDNPRLSALHQAQLEKTLY